MRSPRQVLNSLRGLIATLPSRTRESWQLLPVLAGFAIYVVVWCYITITRFDSHHALVYDLGLSMEQMWLVVHSNLSLTATLYEFLYQGFPYLTFPVALYGGFPGILVLQTIAIGGTALPIYGIAARILKDRLSAMIIALSSLIFFVASGANWYDFHFEIFFPILFLCAYYFLLRGWRRLAFALFVLVCFTRFPFGVFSLLFGLFLLFEAVVLKQDVDGMPNALARRFGLLLTLVTAGLLIVTYLFALPAVLGQGQFSALLQFSQTTSTAGPPTGWLDRVLTLVIPIATLLFLPLFSRRWILFLAPYVLLLYFAGYWAFSYPYAFSFQYVYALFPFLYLSLIDGIAVGMRRGGWWRPRAQSQTSTIIRPSLPSLRAISSTVLLVVVVSALFLEPYGPLNGLAPDPFGLQKALTANETYIAEFDSLSSLIPRSDPDVLIQGNMPELFPRPLAGNEPLVPGVSLFGNFTESDVINGSFPIKEYGKIEYVHFNYAIADLGSPQFIYGIPSMQQFVEAMYDSGAYGILGEAGGMIVLKYNYTGPIVYYRPTDASFSITSLVEYPSYRPYSGTRITSNNVSGNVALWNGPFVNLLPGSYTVSLSLETSNNSTENSALIQALEGPRAALLGQGTLLGSSFAALNSPQPVSLSFYVPGPENYVQFIVRSLHWNGSLVLSGVRLQQTGPPSTTYRAGLSARDALFYQILAGIPAGSTVTVQTPFAGGEPSLKLTTPSGVGPTTDFIVADPYSPGFGCGPFCSNSSSMEGFVNSGLANGTYGMVEEVQGMMLMERGYSGPLTTFEPFQETVYPGSLYSPWPSNAPLPNATISATNVSGDWPALWGGPFQFLAPGTYAVTLQMKVSVLNASNRGEIQVLAGPHALLLLCQESINASTFSQAGQWTNVTATFTAGTALDTVQYLVRVLSWSGTLSVKDITLSQLSYP